MIADPITIRGRNCENANPEHWFPSKDAGSCARYAAAMCHRCPALDVCLEWALHIEAGTGSSGRHGIFGGTTPSMRAKIARKRETAA